MNNVREFLNKIQKSVQEIRCHRITTSSNLRSHDLVVHRDTSENNSNALFQFTEANMKRISALLKNYPEGAQRALVGPALDIAQRQIGWLPISAMHKVAELLSMPRMRVHENATFYGMFNRRFRGKFHMKVCVSLPCMLRGSDALLCQMEKETCCKVGELSSDGMFGVDTVQCQGACANAPMFVVNDDYYEDLTLCDVAKIVHILKYGGIPRAGPQSGRFAAEPITGLTSLLDPPPNPGYGIQRALKEDK